MHAAKPAVAHGVTSQCCLSQPPSPLLRARAHSTPQDLSADPGCGFQAERITELIFRQLIPSLDCQQLVEFLEYLNMQ
jgi:hypothetical protein